MSYKKYLNVIITVAICAGFVGCGSITTSTTASENEVIKQESTKETSEVEEVAASDMFTNRDYEVGYTMDEAVSISLNEGNVEISGDGAAYAGNKLTITSEGTYVISGKASDVQIVVDAPDQKIQLVLDNASITNTNDAVIFVNDADKVFITTVADSANTLSVSGEVAKIDDVNVDGVIFARCDLTLNGEGVLSIDAAEDNGIVSKDDLVITSGVYNIIAGNHGIQGKDSVRISNGTIAIECGEDGLHSDNDEDEDKGFVYIAGGEITVNAGDDGIHAQTDLTIDGGTINVLESYEGLEGRTITINAGDISVISSDDGLNAAGGNDESGWGKENPMAADNEAYIIINGGSLYVNADGDGIDSNGDLTVNGGVVYVDGPVQSANGALDFGGTGTITGGTVVAAGTSAMAQNFGDGSTQASIYVSTATNVTGEVKVTDSKGNTVLTYTPQKAYNSVVISSPELSVGESYKVYLGENEIDVELTSLIYGETSEFGGFGGPRGAGGQGNFGEQGGFREHGNFGEQGGFREQGDFGEQGGFREQGDFGEQGGFKEQGERGEFKGEKPNN